MTIVRERRPVSIWGDMDRIFNSYLYNQPSATEWKPAVDVIEKEDSYVLMADLPGLDKEDLNLNIEDDVLILSAGKEKKADDEVAEENKSAEQYLLRERAEKRFSRSFRIPRDVDRSKMEATFEKGFLRLEMKKSEEAKPFSIEIK